MYIIYGSNALLSTDFRSGQKNVYDADLEH